jgi:hypothetical protein
VCTGAAAQSKPKPTPTPKPKPGQRATRGRAGGGAKGDGFGLGQRPASLTRPLPVTGYAGGRQQGTRAWRCLAGCKLQAAQRGRVGTGKLSSSPRRSTACAPPARCLATPSLLALPRRDARCTAQTVVDARLAPHSLRRLTIARSPTPPRPIGPRQNWPCRRATPASLSLTN